MLDHSKEPLLQKYLRERRERKESGSQDEIMDDLFWVVVASLFVFCVFMLGASFWVNVVKPNPYVQRFVFDNPTCRGYAPDIELMIEDKLLLAQKIASQLGIGQSMQTDIELSDARLESRNAVTGQLTCVAQASMYNPNDNTVTESEIRYTVSSRADGKSGRYLNVL